MPRGQAGPDTTAQNQNSLEVRTDERGRHAAIHSSITTMHATNNRAHSARKEKGEKPATTICPVEMFWGGQRSCYITTMSCLSPSPLPPGPSPLHHRIRVKELCVAVVAATLAALVFGITGSIFLRRGAFDLNAQIVAAEFDFTARSVAQILQVSMADSVNVLTMLAATLFVKPDLSFAEFRTISSSIRTTARQQAIEWIPHVTDAERARVEAEVSAYVGHNVSMSALLANGTLVPRGVAPDYFPVTYVDPIEGNEAILLLDDAASPTRFAPLVASMASGGPVMSNPLNLLQAQGLPGSPLGCLVFVPV